jgi:hypothetical protein
VQNREDVVGPVLVEARSRGREGVYVVEQPQGRRVPGAAAAAELHQQAAHLASEDVLGVAREPTQPFEGPVDESARPVRGKAGRIRRDRRVRSFPQGFQVGIQQVHGETVGRRKHSATLTAWMPDGTTA